MRRMALLLLLALVAPRPLAPQSLFSTRGLGVPLAPADARARALGGVTLGLLGLNTSLVNPAEIAGIERRGISVVIQPSSRSIELDGAEDETGANRFPLARVIYPTRPGVVLSLGYGGFLDQAWAVVTEGTSILGADTLRTRDLVESDGGITQVRLGAAYPLTQKLAIGIAAGLYTGHLDREVTRVFPDSAGREFRGFVARQSWGYSGPLLVAGARFDPLPFLRASASVTWAGELDARGNEGGAPDLSFDMPLQLAAGASALLAPRIMAAVGVQWAGWSSAENGFVPDTAEPGGIAADTWQVGGGLEWQGARAGARSFPLRLGFQYAKLPFKLRGQTPEEWAASLGAGFQVGAEDETPRAVVSAALERGARGDTGTTGLRERFWRFTVSLSLFSQ